MGSSLCRETLSERKRDNNIMYVSPRTSDHDIYAYNDSRRFLRREKVGKKQAYRDLNARVFAPCAYRRFVISVAPSAGDDCVDAVDCLCFLAR